MAFGFDRFDLSTITRRLELPEISADRARPLTLIVRFCGVGNRVWENLMFARGAAKKDADPPKDGEAKAPESTRVESEEAAISSTNEILASACIVGWENVCDDGVPADCTPESALRFLTELAERCKDVWYRVTPFATDRGAFRAGPAPAATADLGKG